MQQLLVVLAVHLMSVVAIGLGRVVPEPNTPSITLSPLGEPPHKSPDQAAHIIMKAATNQLTGEDLSDPDSRSERSLGVFENTKPVKFLTNKHGWTVEIMPNGSVMGTRDPRPRYGIIQTESVNGDDLGITVKHPLGTLLTNKTSSAHQFYGKVALLGFHSNRYLCMGKEGIIYTRGRADQIKEFSQECVFVETMHQHYYSTYCSYKFPIRKNAKKAKAWCLGINNNGTVRLGKKTKANHSFAQFTTRPAISPSTPFPRPSAETVTTPAPPSGVVVKGAKPTKSPGKRRSRRRRRRKKQKSCSDPGGLFNLRCSDKSDIITDITELKRKSSRRRSRNRRRNSNRRRKDRNKRTSITEGGGGGLFQS